MPNIIITAAQMATAAHQGQQRKYTGRDYIEHPYRVAMRVAARPDATEEMVAAALLHDTLEDTTLTLKDLIEAFGQKVAQMVWDLTNPSKSHPEMNRAQRKEMDRVHLGETDWQVKTIKLLDRIDNLREMDGAPSEFKKRYAKESALLADAIGQVDPALRQELLDAAMKIAGG